MHFEYYLTTAFLLLYIWLVPKTTFAIRSGLTRSEVRFLLVLKIVLGFIVAFYFDRVVNYADYTGYNNIGLEQYQLLKTDPILFFTDIFNGLEEYGPGGVFNASSSFWAELRFILLFKVIGLMDLLTAGNFYLNSALFSAVIFWGHLIFFRLFFQMYPQYKWLILLISFLLPSVLVFTACPHKDGIVFLALAITSYIFYSFLSLLKFKTGWHLFFFLFAIGLIFLFRNYLLLAMLPAMATATFCRMRQHKSRQIIFGSYALYGIVFFLSGLLPATFNLPAILVKRRQDFSSLTPGNTALQMIDLRTDLYSFIENLPLGLNHVLFRPFLWEFPGTGAIWTAAELLIYQLLFVLFLFYRKKKAYFSNPFNVFGVCFFASIVLIIGYCIPNAGAIVRYRSIIWIFFLCPLVANIDWNGIWLYRKLKHL